jgi:Holliday junction resolvasome RuvABC ATP-dependent DNA helicase subunit
MAKAKDLRIHEETISLIARCGRGTARPMAHIIKHFCQVATVNQKRTINRAETLEAMKLLGLFPFGLTKREVAFLIKSAGTGVRVRELPILFAIETKAVNDSLSFLAAHGFISVKMGLCEATPRGALYLEQLKNEKFTLPTI